MKKIIFFLLAFSNSFWINAQIEWAKPGANWYYSYSGSASTGYVHMEYTQDSLHLGKNCHVFEKTRYEYSYISGDNYTITLPRTLTYVSNDSVYYQAEDGNFYLLYNFNASINDNWENASPYPSETTAIVTSTGMTDINGFNLQHVEVIPDNQSTYTLSGKIVERIGALEHYMFPEHQADGHEGGTLRCYYDNDFGWYQNPDYTGSCDYLISSIERLTTNDFIINIMPNPASNILHIDLSQIENRTISNTSITVYSIDGKRLFEHSGYDSIVEVDISSWAIGLYNVVVRNQGKTMTKRIQKL